MNNRPSFSVAVTALTACALVATADRGIDAAGSADRPEPGQVVARAATLGVQRGGPPTQATGGTYLNEYFGFNYPSNWRVIYDGADPQSPGFRLVRLFSPDDSEFAEVRYGVLADRRDFLYDTARAYGNRNGGRDSSFPAYEFREAFVHGGVKTWIRRMVLEPGAELFGTEIEVPGQTPGASHYAHIIYKRNTNVPTDSTTSAPRGVPYGDLPAYAARTEGRRQIMTTFRILAAGTRPAPTITGRWNGTNGSGLALDVNSDGTFVSLWHVARGQFSERARGTYDLRGGAVVLRYVSPAVRTETCSDYRLSRDERAGQDVLVLCGATYRK